MHSQEASDMVALFDMDGTLFNLNDRMLEELRKMRSPHEPEINDPWLDEEWLEARRKAIKRVPGFWRDLPKLQVGWDVLEMSQSIGFKTQILTKGPSSISAAWMEKVDCLRKHMAERKYTITVTEDKSGQYGRVLVDDYIDYVEGWLKWRCRGLVIMPAHPWNEGYTHENVIRYDGSNKQEVYDALLAAFSREAKQHWRDALD